MFSLEWQQVKQRITEELEKADEDKWGLDEREIMGKKREKQNDLEEY